LVATYLTGILDRDLHVWLDGYLGPLREVLGLRVTELAPTGAPLRLEGEVAGAAQVWQDVVELAGAQVVSTFADGVAAGGAAVTRHPHGRGVAWYVATAPAPVVLDELVDRWLDEAGVAALLTRAVTGVEAVRRGDLLFLLNHTPEAVELPLVGGPVTVGGYGAVVHPV
ncbi:MAG: beta-galactosidase trimerization domain-containing protein, partial [Actinobacteria bacterium]|nr:beta-galactosidase trimerization domain-containing protein [Actinomycetota bacterium]